MRQLKVVALAFLMGVLGESCSGSEQNLKNVVYLYDDEGVNQEFLKHTRDTFDRFLHESYCLQHLSAEEVKTGAWTRDAALFVMPGGIASRYAEKLEGEANAQIERFVQQGGAYLGLCAGAYYASATVEFDRGGPDEIIAQRDLRLFKGTAIGPVLKAASPETLARPKAALLDVYADQTMHIPFYHAQGCYFEGADGDDEVSVLGRYENGLPAIIHVVHGSGHALLSGVHFEFNPDLLETYQESFPTITCQLRQYETARANFVHVVLKILGLKSWRDVTSLEQNEGRKS